MLFLCLDRAWSDLSAVGDARSVLKVSLTAGTVCSSGDDPLRSTDVKLHLLTVTSSCSHADD